MNYELEGKEKRAACGFTASPSEEELIRHLPGMTHAAAAAGAGNSTENATCICERENPSKALPTGRRI
jgi:hypothetical protein